MFFSGFSLVDEKELFRPYLIENDFTVSGFSYGAQKALEYVLKTSSRVDTLQLFSPSFFNDKDKKYKRMQLIYFGKDAQSYCDNFLVNCGLDSEQKDKYFKNGLSEELEDLLTYDWNEEKLKSIVKRGVNIEIYVGADDEIIDSYKAKEFFSQFGEVYFIKAKGHIL